MTDTAASKLHAEVEGTRPLRALNGRIEIAGWCLAEGLPVPPPVRLRTESGLQLPAMRRERADIAKHFPRHPAASECGFFIEGNLQVGVHVAHFEALGADDRWQTFKTLTVVVAPPPFAASIESPAGSGPITQRVHVAGWAISPAQPISELVVRYGHQELGCRTGLPRADLRNLYPELSHAGESGFCTCTVLSAGIGKVRLKARLQDGTTAVARTGLDIDIAVDENHGPELDLRALRVALPGYSRRAPASVEQAGRSLNILFVLYGNFTSNSALQAGALANELVDAGHVCTIAVPRDLKTASHQSGRRFHACLHSEAVSTGGAFSNERGPDIIHAWTTREVVRRTAVEIQRRHGGRLCVQLEDNEREILTQALGSSYGSLTSLPDESLDALISPDLSHPRRSAEFLAAAAGVTVIIERLREFVPADKPCLTLWPAADARYFFPRPRPDEFRKVLDLATDTTLLFYHGNTHAANAAEMRELYAAVAQLNTEGFPTTLVRAGTDQVDFLGDLAPHVRPHVLELGQILNHRHLPPLMAMADIFVQPGTPDDFNNYRFPSKLPEFFSIGRPVILPKSNLGEWLRHGVDAYVLDRADAGGIAFAVKELRRDRTLHEHLSHGALAFAEAHLSWRRSAAALANFYGSLEKF